MGRSPCCDKVGLKKGPWTPEEDQKLLAYIEEHGHGSWRALPAKAGLQRCGKSCRLRWTNYLRPDIKRGKFSIQEEQTIIQLHALLGNRWSAIATHLPKRTDNEIKNYWNTHLKKRLAKMGIDPVTHKPKTDAILSGDSGQSKHAANLSHMAQWESARLEAEARLVRQSKLRSNSSFQSQSQSQSHLIAGSPEFSDPSITLNKQASAVSASPGAPGSQGCLVILNAWNGAWSKMNEPGAGGLAAADLESPKSSLSYSENNTPQMSSTNRIGESSTVFIELAGNNNSSGSCDGRIMREEGEEDWKGLGSRNNLPAGYKDGIENSISFTSGLQDLTMPLDTPWNRNSLREENPDDDEHDHARTGGNFVERFTDLLLSTAGGSVERTSFSEGCGESDNNNNNGAITTTAAAIAGPGSEYLEENKNYWDSILNLVNCSPSHTPMF